MGEAEDDAEQAGGDQQDAGDVELRAGGLGMIMQQQRTTDERDGGEAQVDIHAPAPGQVFGEHPTEQQTDRRAAATDRAVDAEGPSTLPVVGECRGQQR